MFFLIFRSKWNKNFGVFHQSTNNFFESAGYYSGFIVSLAYDEINDFPSMAGFRILPVCRRFF
jgi:hypothetical protein